MGGQKFQYDESGGTFFYFVLSFLALILIPTTFFSWPKKHKKGANKDKFECKCDECLKKDKILEEKDAFSEVKQLVLKLLIIGGWLLLLFLTYKVSQMEYEMSNFDPYEILKIPVGSSEKDIKKSYRQLSKILHPDKETGDEKEFMKLTKAYQALTDEEAKKNWERYGNPDGPGAMSFGIALPSWIVEKENSFWVLGLYGLVFMVALPIAVGTWWYRSIKFTNEKVLIKTTEIYYIFFHQTPTMMIKRIIMILAASLEFDRRYNSEIPDRVTDNEELPQLIKQLENLNEKNKEKPLCFPYSIKARAIIHAHLSRIPLPVNTLEKDRQYIIKKCPYLILEQVICVNTLIVLAYARKVQRLPTIETIDNCMRLSQMIVQALWEHKSPLLQLPYVKEEHLKYFISKKRHIKSLQQLAEVRSDERRSMLRFLSDQQYENMMNVLGSIPLIEFNIQHEVFDDENTNVVTAGAIVTVTVLLKRRPMKTLFEKLDNKHAQQQQQNNINVNQDQNNEKSEKQIKQPQRPAWMKRQQKQGGGRGNKKTNKKLNRQKYYKKSMKQAQDSSQESDSEQPDKTTKDETDSGESGDSGEETSSPRATNNNNRRISSSSDSNSSTDKNSDSSSSETTSSDNEDKKHNSKKRLEKSSNRNEEDDDQEWEKLQKKIQKKEGRNLEGRSKISHPVHCPYFPDNKQEYWWAYVCDRKSRTLLTAPLLITNLIDQQEVHLKFTAPKWPGVYTMTVCLRSDSYMGLDQQQELKLDIKEAPQIPVDHPQWDISDSDDQDAADHKASSLLGAANKSDQDSEFASDDDIEEY